MLPSVNCLVTCCHKQYTSVYGRKSIVEACSVLRRRPRLAHDASALCRLLNLDSLQDTWYCKVPFADITLGDWVLGTQQGSMSYSCPLVSSLVEETYEVIHLVMLQQGTV